MIKSKKQKKLPGLFTRLISFIPVFNWFSLIIIGIKCSHKISLISGIVYGILTFTISEWAAFIWILVMIQYSVVIIKIKRNIMVEKNNDVVVTPVKRIDKNIEDNILFIEKKRELYVDNEKIEKNEDIFSDFSLEGEEEKKQIIPQQNIKEVEEQKLNRVANLFSEENIVPQSDINVVNHYKNNRFDYKIYGWNKFFRDMKLFSEKEGREVPFVPFMTYFPTYDSMDSQQKSWYFYWRTEIRKGHFINTDLSYIFIYIYELLSGIGWTDATEGYDKLNTIWMQYRESYHQLDHFLLAWTFDFAYLYGIDYITPNISFHNLRYQSTMADILINSHVNDETLKLPVELIELLCDYSFRRSKFYKDGHQLLMEAAIPQVISLVDKILQRKNNKGILLLYGPKEAEKQIHILFQNAICPNANEQIELEIKRYTSYLQLREFINEIVRFTENTLREIYKSRGRLRGVTVDKDIEGLIKKFLEKEYSPKKPLEKNNKKNTLKLDVNSINELRKQSDAVREALEVPEENTVGTKELLTDLEEVKNLLGDLSTQERNLLDDLYQNQWECSSNNEKVILANKINEQAYKYLACALIVFENDELVVEDDYRDELAYIYENHIEIMQKKESVDEKTYFKITDLSEPMKTFIENLSIEQEKIICIIIQNDLKQEKIEKIAEENLTMPEIMLDEINELATQYLDDILIDLFGNEINILEQYKEELRKAMK